MVSANSRHLPARKISCWNGVRCGNRDGRAVRGEQRNGFKRHLDLGRNNLGPGPHIKGSVWTEVGHPRNGLRCSYRKRRFVWWRHFRRHNAWRHLDLERKDQNMDRATPGGQSVPPARSDRLRLGNGDGGSLWRRGQLRRAHLRRYLGLERNKLAAAFPGDLTPRTIYGVYGL